MILEFLHFWFGVPGFPWTGEVAEAEAGGQGGGVAGAGRPGCLRQHTFPTFQETARMLPLHRFISWSSQGKGGNVKLFHVVCPVLRLTSYTKSINAWPSSA